MKKVSFLIAFIFLVSCSSSSSEENLRTGNSITSFELIINGESISGQIDQSNQTIIFNLIDANLTSLTPSIRISDGATISPSPDTPNNFGGEVRYTVTAEDGTTRVYTVIVNNTIRSGANLITSFEISLNGEMIEGSIDQGNNTITFEVRGADLSSITPNIEISDGARINPDGDDSQDFSEVVYYTVTAENGNERTYDVIVNNIPLNSENDILNFVVGINGESIEGRIDQETREIAFETGSFNISNLVPEITVSESALVSPASGESVDFTNPVTYTVTAENGETSEYTILINQAYKVDAYTLYGPRWGAQKLFTRAALYIVTDFLDPEIAGTELFLFDGTNRVDLPIQAVNSYEDRRIISYQITTEIPDFAVSSTSYKIVYRLDDLEVSSDFFIDVLAENSPNITGTNQSLYRPGDSLIITGENLTPVIGVPSNASFYVFNPLGNIDTELSPDKTEYRLELEPPSSFAYTAFFYYSGDTRDVIFINPEETPRIGQQITVNVQR